MHIQCTLIFFLNCTLLFTIKYTIFQKIYIILYNQHTHVFKECIQFCRFNVHDSKDLTYTTFSKVHNFSKNVHNSLTVELNIFYVFKTRQIHANWMLFTTKDGPQFPHHDIGNTN